MGLFSRGEDDEGEVLEIELTDDSIKKKDKKTIKKYLLQDEKVEAALFADWEDLFDSTNNMLVVTDRRVIAVKRGRLLDTRSGFKAIDYGDINSVSFEEPGRWGAIGKIGLGNILGKITLTTQNTTFHARVYKKHAQEIAKMITSYISDSKTNDSSTDASSEDIPGQIEKLADLRDQGVISEDEFEEKKTDLLSRL